MPGCPEEEGATFPYTGCPAVSQKPNSPVCPSALLRVKEDLEGFEPSDGCVIKRTPSVLAPILAWVTDKPDSGIGPQLLGGLRLHHATIRRSSEYGNLASPLADLSTPTLFTGVRVPDQRRLFFPVLTGPLALAASCTSFGNFHSADAFTPLRDCGPNESSITNQPSTCDLRSGRIRASPYGVRRLHDRL